MLLLENYAVFLFIFGLLDSARRYIRVEDAILVSVSSPILELKRLLHTEVI